VTRLERGWRAVQMSSASHELECWNDQVKDEQEIPPRPRRTGCHSSSALPTESCTSSARRSRARAELERARYRSPVCFALCIDGLNTRCVHLSSPLAWWLELVPAPSSLPDSDWHCALLVNDFHHSETRYPRCPGSMSAGHYLLHQDVAQWHASRA